jgi:hypothetical protein
MDEHGVFTIVRHDGGVLFNVFDDVISIWAKFVGSGFALCYARGTLEDITLLTLNTDIGIRLGRTSHQ